MYYTATSRQRIAKLLLSALTPHVYLTLGFSQLKVFLKGEMLVEKH